MTNLAPDFEIHDFDISPDGREVVLERVQEHSDIVLLDLPGGEVVSRLRAIPSHTMLTER